MLKQQQYDLSWRPIQLGSRTLHDAETRYAPTEFELQAIVYATSKCDMFLADHNKRPSVIREGLTRWQILPFCEVWSNLWTAILQLNSCQAWKTALQIPSHATLRTLYTI